MSQPTGTPTEPPPFTATSLAPATPASGVAMTNPPPPGGNGGGSGWVARVQASLDAFRGLDFLRRFLALCCYVIAIGAPLYTGYWLMHGDGQAMPWCEPNEYVWRPWARVALTVSSLVFSFGLARHGERLFFRLVTLEKIEELRAQHAAEPSKDALELATKSVGEGAKIVADIIKDMKVK
jgi:hypothetical protein